MKHTRMHLLAFFVLCAVKVINGQVLWYQPEQIHLAYGESTGDIVVTWSTLNDTRESTVEYGIGGMVLTATGTAKFFKDGGYRRNGQYIHTVTLSTLSPDNIYVYHCGSQLGWSPVFWFKSAPPHEVWQPQLAIYGDMGNENAQSLSRLQQETQRGYYDAILHVGDFAYDMDTEYGQVGDEFMRQIESIAGYVPYMTCPGNHEERYNFSNYLERFNMPGGERSLMYSFDIGPMHIISISTEVYYFPFYGLKPIVFQYEWLENDLIRANFPENRELHPWIIVMGHRPMYCSTTDKDDCTHHETITRVGMPFLHMFGLEKLLYDYGVDIEIWAHEHVYQRLWPIYDYKVYNGSYENPYVNPGAPVHIVTGSAGCREDHDDFNMTKPAWSAFQSKDYGYTRLKAYNASHVYIEQISDDKEGLIIDSFWIVKDSHEPYQYSTMDWAAFDSARLKNFN